MTEPGRRPPGGTGGEVELAEAVAAYLLGAMPPAEARAFERRLAADPAARALLADWRPVIDVLPLTVEEAEPSPALRGRILAAARAEAAPAGPSNGAAPAREAPRPEPTPFPAERVGRSGTVDRGPWTVDRGPRAAAGVPPTAGPGAPVAELRRTRNRPWLAALAAAVLVALGLGYTTWQAQTRAGELQSQLAQAEQRLNQTEQRLTQTSSDLNRTNAQLAQIQTELASVSDSLTERARLLRAVAEGRFARLDFRSETVPGYGLVVIPRQGDPVLYLDGVPPPPAGKVYQAWALQSEDRPPVPGDVFQTDPTKAGIVPVGVSLLGARGVAVTIEEGPNRKQTPTLPPIAVGLFSES